MTNAIIMLNPIVEIQGQVVNINIVIDTKNFLSYSRRFHQIILPYKREELETGVQH